MTAQTGLRKMCSISYTSKMHLYPSRLSLSPQLSTTLFIISVLDVLLQILLPSNSVRPHPFIFKLLATAEEEKHTTVAIVDRAYVSSSRECHQCFYCRPPPYILCCNLFYYFNSCANILLTSFIHCYHNSMGVTSYYSKFHKNKLNKLKLLTNLIISLSLNKSFPKCLDLRLRNFYDISSF